jgi:hypothetical protein
MKRVFAVSLISIKHLPFYFLLAIISSSVYSTTYTERWLSFETKLTKQVKSFQNSPPLKSMFGTFKRVEYQSSDLSLPAYIDTQLIEVGISKPAVVYLHGGFGLSESELRVVDAFTKNGYIVMVPTWRGENQNPGHFEVFMGEVGDARAAVQWLAAQPFVDAKQVSVFGWSVGGGIALNLAMLSDIPVRCSGSSAGIYDTNLINDWATNDDFIVFPYNHLNEKENYFRLPIYHLEDLPRPHRSWIGKDDGYEEIEKLIGGMRLNKNSLFQLVEVPGDHVDSLPLAIRDFIEWDKSGCSTKKN